MRRLNAACASSPLGLFFPSNALARIVGMARKFPDPVTFCLTERRAQHPMRAA